MTVATMPTDNLTLQIVPCTVEEVLAYQHSALVARFQEKLGLTHEEAVQFFNDIKRFLYLCAVSPETISPNETLDFGWHEFILFTRDYNHFCQNYFGRFIHHRPRHPDDPPTKGEGGKRALALAHKVFGNNLSENWRYPRLEGAGSDPCDNCGCNAACNDG